MKLSNYFLPVLRELPKEAEIISHTLMFLVSIDDDSDISERTLLRLNQTHNNLK